MCQQGVDAKKLVKNKYFFLDFYKKKPLQCSAMLDSFRETPWIHAINGSRPDHLLFYLETLRNINQLMANI